MYEIYRTEICSFCQKYAHVIAKLLTLLITVLLYLIQDQINCKQCFSGGNKLLIVWRLLQFIVLYKKHNYFSNGSSPCNIKKLKFNTLGISSIKPDCHDGYNI